MSLGHIAYVRIGDDEVAYSVSGAGPIDLLHLPGLLNHIEAAAEEPAVAHHYAQFASFSRLVRYDKRGSGLSSPLRADRPLTLEERAQEALAVLDALAIEHAAVYATADGVPVALFLAATHPGRVSALALYAGTARYTATADYPEGFDRQALEQVGDAEYPRWGDDSAPATVWALVPSRSGDESVARSIGRVQRMAGTPLAARRFMELFMDTDVRHVLDAVRTPTLVLHCTGDLMVPVAQGRYLASHVRGAEFVEIDGRDHFYFWDRGDEVVRQVRRFLIGRPGPVETNRVLATVLFSDIVASTVHATKLGDALWREVLDRHDALARQAIASYGGHAIKTTGDGFLATFDAPTRAIHCAAAIREEVAGLGLEVRMGIHTGEVETRKDDIGGIAVHVAARVESLAMPNQILVSRTVTDLVAGAGIEFQDQGDHKLKGVPGTWRVFGVSL